MQLNLLVAPAITAVFAIGLVYGVFKSRPDFLTGVRTFAGMCAAMFAIAQLVRAVPLEQFQGVNSLGALTIFFSIVLLGGLMMLFGFMPFKRGETEISPFRAVDSNSHERRIERLQRLPQLDLSSVQLVDRTSGSSSEPVEDWKVGNKDDPYGPWYGGLNDIDHLVNTDEIERNRFNGGDNKWNL